MKFTSALILALSLALPGLSLPAMSNQLINGLMQNAAFKALLEETHFEALEIARIPLSDELRQKCQEYSRSGAALSVNIKVKKNLINFIFVTPESENDLRLCD